MDAKTDLYVPRLCASGLAVFEAELRSSVWWIYGDRDGENDLCVSKLCAGGPAGV